MIETSKAYRAAIKADCEQATFEARLGFIPPGTVEGASLQSSAPAKLCRLMEVKNGREGMDAKWGTLEPGRFRLDGTFALPSDKGQFGFFSHDFCDQDGVFQTRPYIDYIFDRAYDLIGITVCFDDKGGEWATQITIEYYGQDGALLQAKLFPNASATGLFDMTQIGVKRFRAYIDRWSVPARMAKISQVLPGQIYVFTPENAYSFDFSEDVNPFETSVTLPEYTVVFDNADKKFDIVNPNGLVAYLRQKMKIAAHIGVMVDGRYEMVSAGDFYVYSWPDDTQEDKASLTCRPSMAFENRYYVNPGTGTQTAAQAAAIIFNGVEEAYTLDAELAGIVVNQYIGEDVPQINAMGQLAVACCGYWKIDRDGTYHLKKWNPPAPSNKIDYDNAWEKPAIEQSKRYTSVNVKYYVYNSVNEQLKSNDHIVARSPDDGELKSISSSFIPTEARAEIVAQAALAYYAMRLRYTVQYRGDPSMEAGDTVRIENDYALSDVCVQSHELSFDENKLSGKVKGVGV